LQDGKVLQIPADDIIFRVGEYPGGSCPGILIPPHPLSLLGKAEACKTPRDVEASGYTCTEKRKTGKRKTAATAAVNSSFLQES
jgi:hypothetical protein